MGSDAYCGLFGRSPIWLQRFRTPRWFALVLFLVFFCKGFPNTYLLCLVDVLGAQFALSTEEFQWIISVSYLGIIPAFIFLPLIDTIKKKPVCLMLAVWIMGSGLIICSLPKFLESKPTLLRSNLKERREGEYELVLAGYFVFGTGGFILNAVGFPFIDSNVPEEKSPVYVGCFMAGEILGAFFGGLYAESLKTGGYHHHTSHADVGEDVDCWTGFILIGSALFIISPFLSLFPNTLVDKSEVSEETDEFDGNIFSKYIESIGRLITNKVFMLSLASYVFILAAVLGFRNNFAILQMFMFNKTSQEAKIGIILGVTTILTSLVMAGVGAIIKVLRINIQPLIFWNICVCLLTISGFAILYSIGCDASIIYKKSPLISSITMSCNEECNWN